MRWLLWCCYPWDWEYLGDWHLDDEAVTLVMAACREAGWQTQLSIYHPYSEEG